MSACLVLHTHQHGGGLVRIAGYTHSWLQQWMGQPAIQGTFMTDAGPTHPQPITCCTLHMLVFQLNCWCSSTQDAILGRHDRMPHKGIALGSLGPRISTKSILCLLRMTIDAPSDADASCCLCNMFLSQFTCYCRSCGGIHH